MTKLCEEIEDDEGNVVERIEYTTQEEISQHATKNFSELYNMSEDDVSYDPLLVKALDDIRGDPEAQVPEDLKESLGWDEIFSTPNITQAIKSMEESAAGQDGLSYAFWVDALELIPERLSKIFKDLCRTGKMTDLMREAVTTLAYKNKGSKEDWRNYRPIAVTEMAYRILGRCVSIKMGPAGQG